MNRNFAISLCVLATTGLVFTGCGNPVVNQIQKTGDASESAALVAETECNDTTYPDACYLNLDETSATLDGVTLEEFDYVWHTDPSAGKEWYEGDEPQTDAAAYIAHDIWYYPEIDADSFEIVNYDGENEWATHYTAEGLTDYIYATLPVQGDAVPTEMMHSSEDAYENKVLHITKPGTYVLSGSWHGQIFVDLGDKDETFTDSDAKVTLVLDGATINCDVAPAFIAYSAYECDNTWEDRETQTNETDLSEAGVKVIVADGSQNSFTGSNIFRLLKPEYKKDSTSVQKKYHKIDGAFYSFVSMTIDGEENGTGILNITSAYEGLDDELHLTMNGGYVNIYSQNDGINVNEDGVSVFTMNGGALHVFAGLGAEGDGIDSNGFIVVNGGLIAGGTPSGADEILDSDMGNTINGGEVIVIGSGFGMGGMGRPEGMQLPEGMERPEGMQWPEGMEPPEGMERPEGMKDGQRMQAPSEGQLQPPQQQQPQS